MVDSYLDREGEAEKSGEWREGRRGEWDGMGWERERREEDGAGMERWEGQKRVCRERTVGRETKSGRERQGEEITVSKWDNSTITRAYP